MRDDIDITWWMKSMHFCFFGGDQKILTGFYNHTILIYIRESRTTFTDFPTASAS